MSKLFSLILEDDGTVKIKPINQSGPPGPKNPPPGQSFVIFLSIIILGIIFIVNFLISANVDSRNEELPEPTNSPNNSTAKSSSSYEQVRMYFEES